MNLNINFQRVIWLATGPTVHRDQIIQPQQYWQRTPSEHSVGMMILQIYHLSTGSDLIIEGSKTRDAWNEIRRISGATWSADAKFVGIGLSSSYPLSDGNDHLWDFIRWRWAPSLGSSTFTNQSVCFEAQMVTKP